MCDTARSSAELKQHVEAVRTFNRFYTARLGLMRKRHLDGEFALAEARILYEVGARPGVTASELCEALELDAGYMSRLLSGLMRKKLLVQKKSVSDGREKFVTLTAAGAKAVARLDRQSDVQIEQLLVRLNKGDREAIADSLNRVRDLLSGEPKKLFEIERVKSASSEALDILEEYYEAVHVVVRDTPTAIEKILNEPASGMWLARFRGQVAGCVVLRKLESIAGAAECKRMYVRPAARGNRIADALLDAMEAHARDEGMQWIYLDTYDDLKTAIALYERRGYEGCERYTDNPQATLFMRKSIR